MKKIKKIIADWRSERLRLRGISRQLDSLQDLTLIERMAGDE